MFTRLLAEPEGGVSCIQTISLQDTVTVPRLAEHHQWVYVYDGELAEVCRMSVKSVAISWLRESLRAETQTLVSVCLLSVRMGSLMAGVRSFGRGIGNDLRASHRVPVDCCCFRDAINTHRFSLTFPLRLSTLTDGTRMAKFNIIEIQTDGRMGGQNKNNNNKTYKITSSLL